MAQYSAASKQLGIKGYKHDSIIVGGVPRLGSTAANKKVHKDMVSAAEQTGINFIIRNPRMIKENRRKEMSFARFTSALGYHFVR